MDAPAARHDGQQPATVDVAGLHADGTRLVLRDGRVVQLNALPDPEGPHRVQRVLRRIARVDLHLAAAQVTANVSGVGHRRTSRIPVSLGTALALVLDGVPTAVTFDASVTTTAPSGALA